MFDRLCIVGTECTSLFLEPLSWMNESGIAEGNVEGKLMCNGCSSRIGSFAWSGEQCSCGAWVTPAFQVSVYARPACVRAL